MWENAKKIIGTIFKKKEFVDYENKTSVFADIILEAEEKTSGPVVFKCANLLEEALKISKQRIILLDRCKKTSEEISEMDFIIDLDEDEFNYFKNLVNRYINMSSEKSVLMYQIEGFDSILGHLVNIEGEARETLPKLINAEKERAMFNRDIAYLEMEKTDLKEEKELLEQGLVFIKYSTVGLVIVSTFVALILGFLNIFNDVNIFYPTVFLSIFLIFFIAFFSILKSKIKSDLKLNIRKQNKAISLLNKKNVVYVHHTKFVTYVYKKYKVKNSKHMSICLDELDDYKKLMDRVKVTKRVLNETENELELYFIKKNIKINKLNMYDFVVSIDLDRKRDRLNRLIEDKKQIDNTLNEFYDMQNNIWLQLESLKEENKNELPLIDEMMKMFYREVDKFSQVIDKSELSN